MDQHHPCYSRSITRLLSLEVIWQSHAHVFKINRRNITSLTTPPDYISLDFCNCRFCNMLRTVPLLWALWAASVAAIWPLPSSYSHGDSVLWIDPSVRILYNGTQVDSFFSRYPIIQALSGLLSQTLAYSSGSENNGTSGIVSTAIQRTYTTLFDQNFVPWNFHPRNSNFQPGKNGSSIYITSIALQQTAADPATIIKPADGAIDESYSLEMTSSGTVTITAATSIGLAYGLTTLTQLFYKHTDGCIYTPLAPVKITDSPTFPHRGLNMDVARAYYAPSDILRMIDALGEIDVLMRVAHHC